MNNVEVFPLLIESGETRQLKRLKRHQSMKYGEINLLAARNT
jgi:hypothetical protein